MILADVHAYQKLNSEDRNNIENLIDRENLNLVIFLPISLNEFNRLLISSGETMVGADHSKEEKT